MSISEFATAQYERHRGTFMTVSHLCARLTYVYTNPSSAMVLCHDLRNLLLKQDS